MDTAAQIRQTVVTVSRKQKLSVLASEVPVIAALLFVGFSVLLWTGTNHFGRIAANGLVCAGLIWRALAFRSKLLDRYSTAQRVDRDLQLADTLSTAFWIVERQVSTATTALQLRQATAMLPQISASTVFPFRFDRKSILAAAISAALVLMLAVVRYGTLGSLDLQRPAPPATALATWTADAREVITRALARSKHQDQQIAIPSGANIPDADTGKPIKDQFQKEASQTNSTSSFLEGMKDAAHSLSSQLRQAMSAGQQPQPEKQPTGQEQTQAKAPAQGQPGNGRPNANNSNSAQDSALAQTPKQAKAVEHAPGTPLGPAQSAAQEKGNDAQSGAGRDIGQKQILNADELKAIGNLQELMGKRSAGVSGEMKLSKSSHDQQLQTQYTNETAAHTAKGGEIHQDEIPPEYRDYVRRYMDSVHAKGQHPGAH